MHRTLYISSLGIRFSNTLHRAGKICNVRLAKGESLGWFNILIQNCATVTKSENVDYKVLRTVGHWDKEGSRFSFIYRLRLLPQMSNQAVVSFLKKLILIISSGWDRCQRVRRWNPTEIRLPSLSNIVNWMIRLDVN